MHVYFTFIIPSFVLARCTQVPSHVHFNNKIRIWSYTHSEGRKAGRKKKALALM